MLTCNVDSMADPALQEANGAPPRRRRSWVRRVGPLVGLVVIFAGVVAVRASLSHSTSERPTAVVPSTLSAMPTSPAIESTYGIRFTGVDVTAGGGMIQIRYQVLNSDKTEAIHGTDLSPIVIDSRGAKYADPGMVGHSHVGKTLKAGATDYILLADALGGVKAGSLVTIKVGDLELRNVPVA